MEDLLRGPIKAGCLNVIAPDGQRYTLKGPAKGPEASIRIADRRLLRRMLVVPDLYLGEGYMDGTVTIEEGSLYDVLDFFACNLMPRVHETDAVVLPSAYQNNVVGKAKDNVAFHYDLNRALFELFLDHDLQYSCAYFADDRDTLEDAQSNKKKRAAAKLLLKPGMRVLDIGSGFGGLGLYLARTFDVEVTGLTLSEEQWQVSTERARAAGVDRKALFKLRDYREETGDTIASSRLACSSTLAEAITTSSLASYVS